MKKLKMLLFAFILCFLMIKVEAKTGFQIETEVNEALTNYALEVKYVEMPEVINILKTGETEAARRMQYGNPYAVMLSNYVRSKLEKKLNFSDITAIDLFCYIEGDSFTGYNEETHEPETRIAEETFCEAHFYIEFENESPYTFSKTFDVTLTKAEKDVETYNKAVDLVKDLNKPVFVYDIDLINHYINYDKVTSTFFDSENSMNEFSKLKEVKEKNPNFDFFIGFEDTRRGEGTVGLAEGSTFIAKDDVIYGFTYNSYYAGGLFVVPLDTPVADLNETLENRLKEYTKGLDAEIDVLPFSDSSWPSDRLDMVSLVPKMFGVTEEQFYINAKTTPALEKEKMESAGGACDYEGKCLTGYLRELKLNGKTYGITIIPYDMTKLENLGTISTVDYKTGVRLSTNSNNIPLDASLNTQVLELTAEEKTALEKNGYDAVSGYNFALYSKILDKYINQFNSLATVLIPIDKYNENMEIVYIKDNNEIEKYSVELVTIEGKNYLAFKTLHFSKYYIVNKTEVKNPNTGDNLGIYLISGTIGLMGLLGASMYFKKKKVKVI